METFVAVIILCEVLVTLACVFGLLHEDRLVRFERAFAMAIIWHLYERFCEKKVYMIKGEK